MQLKMKKLLKLCLSTAFVVYLAVAIDFFPFEMYLNLLDWDGTRLSRFIVVFFIAIFFWKQIIKSFFILYYF